MDGTKETVKEINQVNNNSVRIMKEKILLLSKRGKKLVKKEKKLKSYLEKFKGTHNIFYERYLLGVLFSSDKSKLLDGDILPLLEILAYHQCFLITCDFTSKISFSF